MTLAGSLAASACWLALSPLTAPDLLPAVAHRRSTGGRSSRSSRSSGWRPARPSCRARTTCAALTGPLPAEEAAFLPVYVAAPAVPPRDKLADDAPWSARTCSLSPASPPGSHCADTCAAGGKLMSGSPERSAGYGIRGQVGGMLSLVNLRLDVAILGALVGPGTLGVYAVASKYAELLRLARAGHHVRAVPAPGRRGTAEGGGRGRSRSCCRVRCSSPRWRRFRWPPRSRCCRLIYGQRVRQAP